jgi:hypothetical protein
MDVMKDVGKVLLLDIETRPATAYVWRFWDETISPDQVISSGGTICVGLKWLGKKDCFFFSEWEHGHEGMIRAVHKMMSEADAVITYNGEKFDLPKLQGNFLMYGLAPPPPHTSIDVLKTVKRMGFDMNRLAYVGPLLKVGAKVKHEGFTLWRKVMDGNEKAQAKMTRYCLQDVRLLERLYKAVRPYIKNHPHLGTKVKAEACGACGGTHLQKRGVRRTKSFLIQRVQCMSCGSWQDGARKKA